MYQIRRKHTKCVVDFGQANMLGHDNSGYQNIKNSSQCSRYVNNVQGRQQKG